MCEKIFQALAAKYGTTIPAGKYGAMSIAKKPAQVAQKALKEQNASVNLGSATRSEKGTGSGTMSATSSSNTSRGVVRRKRRERNSFLGGLGKSDNII